MSIEAELKDYNRKNLIEEIARLRLVLVKGNFEVYKKARKIFRDEKKEVLGKLKDEFRINTNFPIITINEILDKFLQ